MGALANINSDPRFTRHLVDAKIFSDNPLVVVDVGARGGFAEYWNNYRDQFKLIGFEPDKNECDKLNKTFGSSNKKFYPIALSNKKGIRKFYVTSYLPASGFYEPDMEFWKRFDDRLNLKVKKAIKVETLDLDSFLSQNKIGSVDFIKLDVEGAEFDVLTGAKGVLNKSVLGLSIEVEFHQTHKKQPVFTNLDIFLRNLGFRLYDISIYRHQRSALPKISTSKIPGPSNMGQVIWGQALYLKDPLMEFESSKSNAKKWDKGRLLKTASLMELFCLNDCAIELIEFLRKTGKIGSKETKSYTDLLVPVYDGRRMSLSDYSKIANIVKQKGYLSQREWLQRLTSKFRERLASIFP